MSLHTSTDRRDIARAAFLSEWRVITTTLSQSVFGQDILSPEDARLSNILNTLRQADIFLSPLTNNANHESRLRNLEEVMKRAARLGWILFSQPSEFSFDWTGDGEGLVVFPALLQIADENGRVLRTPRVLASKEVVPL
jgi:hypothetical protein